MISFIIGLFVGDFLGVALMALLAMARDPEPPKCEPTKLWLSGNICKYKGEVYTVVSMTTSKFDNDQTLVFLENEHGETVAPIEELEVVEE